MNRDEMRAHLAELRARDDHWLKRANRTLQARLEANRVAQGWPAVPQGPVAPEPVRPPVQQQRPPREIALPEQPKPIYERDEYRETTG